MTTWLERYQKGEHAAVWAELTALGEDVRARKLRDDAIAVARETMRRARRNIDTLLPRLREIGYQFHDPKPFAPPPRRTAETVKTLEKRLGGKLPYSLTAWWEQVGEVSFLGSHPALHAIQADPLVVAPLGFAVESLENWTSNPPFLPPPGMWETSIEAWRRSLRAEGRSPEEIEAELAPSIAMFEAQDLENERLDAIPFDRRFRFAIAPDELTKAEVKGKTFDVLLPSPTADFQLEGAAGTPYFVDYLRQSFRYGGFRGWAEHPDPPLRELDFLTGGLLPL